MNDLEEEQGMADTVLEQCCESYCSAFTTLLDALIEYRPRECKELYDSMLPPLIKVAVISRSINAAKRQKRMDEIAKRMPQEGDEGLVDICPCRHGGETWMQMGKVLLAWDDNDARVEDAIWAVIEITRSLTNEENDRYWSDDSWTGAKFVCRLSYCGDDWRAIWPANDHARKEWGCKKNTGPNRLSKIGNSIEIFEGVQAKIIMNNFDGTATTNCCASRPFSMRSEPSDDCDLKTEKQASDTKLYPVRVRQTPDGGWVIDWEATYAHPLPSLTKRQRS